MFQSWVRGFTQLYPNVEINTANTGSGTGQSFVEKGLVQIGGSATFLSNAQEAQFPNILNIALAVTSDIIDYNVPEVPRSMHLNFTASLLSQIYNSTVQYWDDNRIKNVNSGAAKYLPHQPMWPIYRSDAAGDTWLFTKYLSTEESWWNSTVGYGLTVNWPACIPPPTEPCPSTAQSALGNPGIVISTNDRRYSLSYVSIEAQDQWVLRPDYTLGYGLLQNGAGNFVEATLANLKASIDALAPNTPSDERFSLSNAPGPYSYPIVGYGYALVNVQQATPEFGLVLRTFLKFCLMSQYGNSMTYLSVYHFAPLPPSITQLSLNQVAAIGP